MLPLPGVGSQVTSHTSAQRKCARCHTLIRGASSTWLVPEMDRGSNCSLNIMNHTCSCTAAVTPDLDDDVLLGYDLPIFKPIMREIFCKESDESKTVLAVTTRQQAKTAAEAEQCEQQASAASGADIKSIGNNPATVEEESDLACAATGQAKSGHQPGPFSRPSRHMSHHF